VLAAVGNAAGAHPHALVAATRHTALDFFCLVGRTSKARKGDSFPPVRVLLRAADEAWESGRIANGLSSAEGLIFAVRDQIEKTEAIKEKGKYTGEYQTVVVDPGEEDKRLLVVEPEFGRVLRVARREGNTLSATLREAWDSDNLRTMTKNSPLRATGAH